MFAQSKIVGAPAATKLFFELFTEFIISSAKQLLFGPSFAYGENMVTTRYVSESGHVLDFRCYFNTIDGSTRDNYQLCINDVSRSSKFTGSFEELREHKNYFETLMNRTGIPMHAGKLVTAPAPVPDVSSVQPPAYETIAAVYTVNPDVVEGFATDEPNIVPVAPVQNAVAPAPVHAVPVQNVPVPAPAPVINPVDASVIALAVTKEAIPLLRMWMEEQAVGSIEFITEPGFCSFEVDGFGIGVELRRTDRTTITIAYETQTYQFSKEEFSAVDPEVWGVLEKFIDFDMYGLR